MFGRRLKPPDAPHAQPPAVQSTAPPLDVRPAAAEPDRRAHPRIRVLLSAKLIISGGARSLDCTIRDLTLAGARVQALPATFDLPDEFGLLVIRDCVLFDCRAVWRTGNQIGLSFLRRHDLKGSDEPAFRGVLALWRELAPR